MKTKVTATDYKVSIMFVIVCAIIAAIMGLFTDDRSKKRRIDPMKVAILRPVKMVHKMVSRMLHHTISCIQRMLGMFGTKTNTDPVSEFIGDIVRNTPEDQVVHLDDIDGFFKEPAITKEAETIMI